VRAFLNSSVFAAAVVVGALGLVSGCKAKASVNVNSQADAESEANVKAGSHEAWSDTENSPSNDAVVQQGSQEQGRAIEPAEGGMPAGGPPSATFPGFRMLSGGRSRVFVELHGRVEVDQSPPSEGRLSYRLKGAKVPYRVNGMSLPTNHFATPVARVRLVGADDGAELIIDLRRQVQPQVNLRAADNGTTLSIDFPPLSDADAKVVAEANKAPAPEGADGADGSQ
jgi:hypothetical protein